MFTTVEIAEVTGGKLLGGSVTVTGVSTDTRTIAPGMLFVAIRGESFDGNDYIGAAAEKGAAAAISDRSSGADGYSIPVILVEDSRAAQLALARYHRERFPLKLVGVTGSVGKTSTKDMVMRCFPRSTLRSRPRGTSITTSGFRVRFSGSTRATARRSSKWECPVWGR